MRSFPTSLVIVATLAFASACSKQPATTANTETSTPTSTPSATTSTPASSFERDLAFVRGGQYSYIWVFGRKDGKPLDKEDADFLRKHAPQVVDWAITDEGKRAIGGTNFDLELGDMDLLKKRFVVEDYTGK